MFDRFDRYAPFVEVLHVYHDGREFFLIPDWSALLLRAKVRPLLPNLKRLYIASAHPLAKLTDLLMWIRTCATSSIVEVSTSIRDCFVPNDSWAMSYASALETMDVVVRSCPNIQRLSLFPHLLHDRLAPDPWKPLASPSPKRWFDYLSELPSLRHLEVTNSWLTNISLVAISRLTSLETLDLHLGDFQGFGIPWGINSDLSDDAFLSLCQLSLSCATSYAMDKFPTIPKLFKTMSELNVHISREEGDNEYISAGSSVTVIFPWVIHAPHLNILRALCPLGG